jgi:AcrR family transcriptional regulator
VPAPGYSRLDVDERRRQLLELGAELFARHSYDELSMADIAREGDVSKALLYHYFPSKQDFFQATLAHGAGELAALIEPDPALPPLQQLDTSLDAFLRWIEENSAAYRKLMESATGSPEVRGLIQQVREGTAARILGGLVPEGDPPPRLRTAVRGWLWFMDGACLDWIERREYDRAELRGLLVGTLVGALLAAGAGELALRLQEGWGEGVSRWRTAGGHSRMGGGMKPEGTQSGGPE